MKHYVLDANAVVRYIRGTEGAEKVEAIARQCEQQRAVISMSVINLGEAYYVIARYLGDSFAAKMVHSLAQFVTFVPVDLDQAIHAAKIKEQFHLGYADAFAGVVAIRKKAAVVTADAAFEKLGKSIQVLKLPGFRRN